MSTRTDLNDENGVYKYRSDYSQFGYTEGGGYPEAGKTQRFVCERLDSDQDVLTEFEHASESRWAEWVASVTPYGAEAHKVQLWQADAFRTKAPTAVIERNGSQERHPNASRLDNDPIFPTTAEGLQAIRDCVYKVHLYFNPAKEAKGLGRLFGKK